MSTIYSRARAALAGYHSTDFASCDPKETEKAVHNLAAALDDLLHAKSDPLTRVGMKLSVQEYLANHNWEQSEPGSLEEVKYAAYARAYSEIRQWLTDAIREMEVGQ